MKKPKFGLLLLTMTLGFPFGELTMPQTTFGEYGHYDEVTLPVIFEDHEYTLYTVDEQGKYYYVERGGHLHRYDSKTDSWEMNLLESHSLIRMVHVTANNYIFVGLLNGTVLRSINGGKTFPVTHEWQKNGHSREWSIASDEEWVLLGEYGEKIKPRQVYASDDWGDHWTLVYETPEQEGVHIHRVAIDPYTSNWWIMGGDYPAGRVLYSSDYGSHWNEVKCPETGREWQPYQPANIVFFEHSILIINEPLPQVFKVDRMTMEAEYITDIGNFSELDLAAPYSIVVGDYGIYTTIVRYPEHTHDSGIFVSYDDGYTWQRLTNFTAWAETRDQSIELSQVFGANELIYADGYIHARWILWPWGNPNEQTMEGGRAFKFKDAHYFPNVQKFTAVWNDIAYPVIIHSNSLVSDFYFNQPKNQIHFYVSSDSHVLGYNNITIPKTLLKGNPWVITRDDIPVTNVTQLENATHLFIYFTYPQPTTQHIKIMGTLISSEDPLSSQIPLTTQTPLTTQIPLTNQTSLTSQTPITTESPVIIILPMVLVLLMTTIILIKYRFSGKPE